jgi:hypothetical protein
MNDIASEQKKEAFLREIARLLNLSNKWLDDVYVDIDTMASALHITITQTRLDELRSWLETGGFPEFLEPTLDGVVTDNVRRIVEKRKSSNNNNKKLLLG